MYTRPLIEKDAPYMLEWMHSGNVTKYLANNFCEMQLEDCETFIRDSKDDKDNLHLAICDSQDEYLGTVSLKHIDWENRNAEYAISTREIAHGTGAAQIGTQDILKKAFEELDLNRVYLNVIEENIRAECFYKKIGFLYEGMFREHLYIKGKFRNLKWYSITAEQYYRDKK